MVRDATGTILDFQSKTLICSLLMEAEIETLEWASSTAMKEYWGRIEWLMDAKKVVELIISNGNGGWSSYYNLINIQK